MKAIFAVMNTTKAVVKRPEKKFRPVRDLAYQSFMPSFHHCLSSVHYCEDRFHIHAFLSYLHVTSSRKMFVILSFRRQIYSLTTL